MVATEQIIAAVATCSFGSAREIVDYFGGSVTEKRRTLHLVAQLKKQQAIRVNNRHWLPREPDTPASLPTPTAASRAARGALNIPGEVDGLIYGNAPSEPTESDNRKLIRFARELPPDEIMRLEVRREFQEANRLGTGLARFGLRESSSIEFMLSEEGVEAEVQRELNDPSLASRLQAVFDELSRDARRRELAGIKRRRAYQELTESHAAGMERKIAARKHGKKKLGPAESEVIRLICAGDYPSASAIAKSLRDTKHGRRTIIKVVTRMELFGLIEWVDGAFVSRWQEDRGAALESMAQRDHIQRQARNVQARHAARATGVAMPLTAATDTPHR